MSILREILYAWWIYSSRKRPTTWETRCHTERHEELQHWPVHTRQKTKEQRQLGSISNHVNTLAPKDTIQVAMNLYHHVEVCARQIDPYSTAARAHNISMVQWGHTLSWSNISWPWRGITGLLCGALNDLDWFIGNSQQWSENCWIRRMKGSVEWNKKKVAEMWTAQVFLNNYQPVPFCSNNT